MLCYWGREEMNNPGRIEHYLMLINTSVNRILHKNPNTVRIEQSRLTFSYTGKVKQSPEERRARIEHSKAAWAAAAGGRKRMTIMDREGNVLRPALLPPIVTQFFGKLGRPKRSRPDAPVPPPSTSPSTFRRLRPRPHTLSSLRRSVEGNDTQRKRVTDADRLGTRNSGDEVHGGHQGSGNENPAT